MVGTIEEAVEKGKTIADKRFDEGRRGEGENAVKEETRGV